MFSDALTLRNVLCVLFWWLAAASSFAAPVGASSCEEHISVHCGKTPTAVWYKDRLWVAFVQRDILYVTQSTGADAEFSEPVAVNNAPEAIETNGENRPTIALTDKAIVVSWTQKTEGDYTGDIRFSRSIDGGKTFEAPRTINDDGLLISHRFDSLLAYPSGVIYITWLDKRNKNANQRDGTPYAGSAVFYAVSTDHGKTFSNNRLLADNSCECCRIAIAPAADSGAAIFWRQIFNDSIRDHSFAQVSTTGIVTKPKRVTVDNWKINACPHHGPDLAVASKDAYHLAWFSNGSHNQGILYGLIDPSSGKVSHVTVMDASASASHPQVIQLADRTYFAWKLFDGEQTVIRLAVSNDEGQSWSEPYTLTQTMGPSDHPQLISTTDGVYLSWHTQNEGFRLLAADVSTSITNE